MIETCSFLPGDRIFFENFEDFHFSPFFHFWIYFKRLFCARARKEFSGRKIMFCAPCYVIYISLYTIYLPMFHNFQSYPTGWWRGKVESVSLNEEQADLDNDEVTMKNTWCCCKMNALAVRAILIFGCLLMVSTVAVFLLNPLLGALISSIVVCIYPYLLYLLYCNLLILFISQHT